MYLRKTRCRGALEEWQGVDLSLLPVGDTTLVAKYNTVYGCDSTYTLNLTVNERPTTYGELRLDFCEGESVAYQGKVYTSSAEEEVLLEEKNHMGGDSIVRLKVYSHYKNYLRQALFWIHQNSFL